MRCRVTRAASKAETDPPPGAEDRAPTLRTNWSTLSLAKGPTALTFKRYSMILSLTFINIRINGWLFHIAIELMEHWMKSTDLGSKG